MKKYLIAVLLILTTAAVAPIYHNYRIAHVYGKSIVRILGPNGGGTGFQIDYKGDSWIVTNDHVCALGQAEGYLTVINSFAQVGHASIRYRSMYTDLCLLSPHPQLPSLKIAKNEAKPGDRITVIGHPYLDKITSTSGRAYRTGLISVVMSYIENEADEKACNLPKNKVEDVLFGIFKVCTIRVRAQPISAEIHPGNSGSPAFNSHGEVVGVVFAGDEATHQGFIIPFKNLIRFLNAVHRQEAFEYP